ncbi:uncharacterized protein KY384_005671 [Bacidia gigantensis]|uniref:uncharacterized protein n=1 Tax=Bacidia gigantensis TaxID=2732470 RepID=UPI001D04ECD9|nr:uncharacterized protein KY384_005671 [Bacidia gigantensis]KAG8529037.1 hypothetical protein KY384_005671 [Bacidia gigantensis]
MTIDDPTEEKAYGQEGADTVVVDRDCAQVVRCVFNVTNLLTKTITQEEIDSTEQKDMDTAYGMMKKDLSVVLCSNPHGRLDRGHHAHELNSLIRSGTQMTLLKNAILVTSMIEEVDGVMLTNECTTSPVIDIRPENLPGIAKSIGDNTRNILGKFIVLNDGVEVYKWTKSRFIKEDGVRDGD